MTTTPEKLSELIAHGRGASEMFDAATANMRRAGQAGAAAYMAALRADMAYMRSLGLSHEAIRQVVAEHDAGDMSMSKLVEHLRAAARVMAEDAVSAAERERDEARDALRALVDALPRCAGEWLTGSGGHIGLGPCGRPATLEDDDNFYQRTCDAHRNILDPYAYELAYAEPLRRALALLASCAPTA